jgi:hypothetical protein
MNDRELLALAAKAAGFGGETFVWSEPIYVDGNLFDHGGLWDYVDGSPLWNPLVSDGDALRLAVVLSLNVFHTGGCAYAMESDCDGSDEQKVSHHSIDKFAATRRAIVRAAAVIGGQS